MAHHLKRTAILLILCAVTALLGCEETPPEITTPAFDRAKDVTLVCYDVEARIPLPLSCCKQDGIPSDAACGVGLPYAEMFAFVTQTTMGEVAVVNMRDYEVIDQEVSIPYANFIPVGGGPNDILAKNDGSKVYTANYETGDLSVIRVIDGEMSVIDTPSLTTTHAIDIGGAAARMGMVARPSAYAERFIFVTQPTLGRVAIVAIDETLCDGYDGCLVGTLSLRAEAEEEGDTETDTDILDGGVEEDGGPENTGNERPFAIEMSENTPSVFVGILGAAVGREIIELDAEVLIAEALATYSGTPVELSDAGVVQYLDTDGREPAELSIEPVVEKWMYGIDNLSGNLFVMNLRENELEVLEDGSSTLEIPGRAIALKLFHANQNSDPSPFTFQGTFAMVSSTMSTVSVIDVDDQNADPYHPHAHTIRSKNNYNDYPPELVGDPGPAVSDPEPKLFFQGESVLDDDRPLYIYFENDPTLNMDGHTDTDTNADTDADTDTGEDTEESDGGLDLPDCADDVDGGVLFKPVFEDLNYGVRFRCDNHESSSEKWTLVWEGAIGLDGAAVLVEEIDDSQVLLRDESTDFCNRGMKVDIRIPGAAKDAPGDGSGTPQTYLGDVLVITSPPSPENEDTDCSFFENEQADPAMYKIEKVQGTNEIVITNTLPLYGSGTAGYPMPSRACFGQAFNYEIRAYRHWTLIGSTSGRLRDTGAFDPETETCVPAPTWDELRTQRVFPNVEFANTYISFTAVHGENYDFETGIFSPTTEEDTGEDGGVESDTDTDEIAYELPEKPYLIFWTGSGYLPFQYGVAANLTDIEVTPDMTFLMVDQARYGLMHFNLMHQFYQLGRNVN